MSEQLKILTRVIQNNLKELSNVLLEYLVEIREKAHHGLFELFETFLNINTQKLKIRKDVVFYWPQWMQGFLAHDNRVVFGLFNIRRRQFGILVLIENLTPDLDKFGEVGFVQVDAEAFAVHDH